MGDIPIISLQNVEKSFRMNDGINQLVLDDINLNVFQNEMIGLIGYSGCGKTTMLRIICAFENADNGYIIVDGKNHISPNRNVLMLFQDFNQLLPWKTVLQNVTYPLLATKFTNSKSEAKSHALKRLEDVGLLGAVNSYPHQLSGGMKQRVAVARALALQPRVLLMDEPFASLDNTTRKTLQILTRRVCNKYGVTTIFVTHSVEEAVIMADRIVIMSENPGRIFKIIDNNDRETQSSEIRVARCAKIMELMEAER